MERLLRCGFPGGVAAAAAGAASSAATAGGGAGGLRTAGATAGPDPVGHCLAEIKEVSTMQWSTCTRRIGPHYLTSSPADQTPI